MTAVTLELTDASRAAAEALVRAAGFHHAREGDIDALRRLCAHPEAPEDFLLAVCHLPECQDVLAHRPLPRRVLEVLAELYRYPEALLTLGKQLYEDPSASMASFRAFLERHTDDGWLYETLAHSEPSTDKKEQALLSASAGTQWMDRVQQIRELKRNVQTASDTTDEILLRRLFQENQPEVWLALASNRHTPPYILQQLASVSDVKFARQIRAAALEQLRMLARTA
jgi:hypothetical protein